MINQKKLLLVIFADEKGNCHITQFENILNF